MMTLHERLLDARGQLELAIVAQASNWTRRLLWTKRKLNATEVYGFRECPAMTTLTYRCVIAGAPGSSQIAEGWFSEEGAGRKRYPIPRTVSRCCGLDGSFSIYLRNRTIKLSMARVSVSSCSPHTSSRICLRETTRPSLRTKCRNNSDSISVKWITLSAVRSSRTPKSIVFPLKENVPKSLTLRGSDAG